MFAVIRTGGKQYKVAPGDVLTVEKLTAPEKEITFQDVLLVGGEKVTIGQPTVAGAKVTAEVLEQGRGEKIRVFKYQAKSHWSRTKGHRQDQTTVKIKEVLSEDARQRELKVPSELNGA